MLTARSHDPAPRILPASAATNKHPPTVLLLASRMALVLSMSLGCPFDTCIQLFYRAFDGASLIHARQGCLSLCLRRFARPPSWVTTPVSADLASMLAETTTCSALSSCLAENTRPTDGLCVVGACLVAKISLKRWHPTEPE